MASDYFLRPMRAVDAVAAERLSDAAFYDHDVRLRRAGWPEPEHRSEDAAALWRRCTAHILEHDPGGCWVAEDASGLIGVATSVKRELTWILSTYAVTPRLQGRGVGKQLLDAAMSYGRGCLRGMLAASDDPSAARRYRLAGFTLHPTMLLRGKIERAKLPVVERVRPGGRSDIDLMDSIDRRVRDSAHGVDHELMLETHPLVVADRTTGSGYVYLRPGGGVYLLAATNRRTATDLMWEALAATSPDEPCTVTHLSPAQEWAVDVGMAARMELHARGYLGLRSMKPPLPYIHSGLFL